MHGLAVLQGNLWVVGGCGGGLSCVTSYSDVWIGLPNANSWQQSTAAASFGGRAGHGMNFSCQAHNIVFYCLNKGFKLTHIFFLAQTCSCHCL